MEPETPQATPEAADPQVQKMRQADVKENKDIAALSYAWVLSIFVYFAKRDSAFVRFHARQGMTLFGLSLVIWLIPFIRRPLELVVLGFAVIGFLAAAQGQWKELPVIYGLSRGDFTSIRKGWKDFVSGVAAFIQRRKKKDGAQAVDTSKTETDPAPAPETEEEVESIEQDEDLVVPAPISAPPPETPHAAVSIMAPSAQVEKSASAEKADTLPKDPHDPSVLPS